MTILVAGFRTRVEKGVDNNWYALNSDGTLLQASSSKERLLKELERWGEVKI